ncbi:MAG: glycosyltransferase family 2 protein [Lachnospiraceae bacterium]|nr:glycosyltransferase family 2 protein [Lachnospiraceae bacterium]
MRKVIVSLTTYPARIAGIRRVLDSLMRQTYKPDKVVISLAEDQFDRKMVPVDLSPYIAKGLEIHWCQHDMKAHKKYLYALQEYHDSYVITVDDDFYYDCYLVEELVRNAERFPGCVLARRSHLITADRLGNIAPYEKWWSECIHYVEKPRMDLFAVGCGGILYPPNAVNREAFNIENVKRYCLYADDIWLKIMELMNNTPVVQIDTRYYDIYHSEYRRDGLYQNYNGNGGNDKQLHELLNAYCHLWEQSKPIEKKIFSDGMVYEDEVEAGKLTDDKNYIDTWIKGLERYQKIVLYGAGTMAERVYRILEKYHYEDRVTAFVVKDPLQNPGEIEKVKVVQYQQLDYRGAACIICLKNKEQQLLMNQELLRSGLEEWQILRLNDRMQRIIGRQLAKG